MKSIKQLLKDENAVSFGYLVIAAFLIGGTAIWIEFAPVFNTIFGSYNSMIGQGMVTKQNSDAMTFHYNVIYIVPLIMLIAIGCWGIIRALEHRNEA